jgi:Flp pilus assembly pilin Flp
MMDSQTVILLCSAIGAAQVVSLALIAYFQAVKVEIVRRDLQMTGASVTGKLDDIHTAVNSERTAMIAEVKRLNDLVTSMVSHGSSLN